MSGRIDLKRLNVNMPEELVNRIDEYAKKMGINRTSAINVLCNKALTEELKETEKKCSSVT